MKCSVVGAGKVVLDFKVAVNATKLVTAPRTAKSLIGAGNIRRTVACSGVNSHEIYTTPTVD